MADLSRIDPLDLDACAREPIHIPGSIQPHGLLLSVATDGRVSRASANAAELLGRGSVLGASIHDLIPSLEAMSARASLDPAAATHLGRLEIKGRWFDLIIHDSGAERVVELEEAEEAVDIETQYQLLRGFVGALERAQSLDDLCAVAAQSARALTGFDRALVYRFDQEWNGNVVGESGNGVLPSYLGLRFPATDIPAQARELYLRNRLRIIPDANYRPVPLMGLEEGVPLDLSLSVLRSVSPVHLEYMRNMGTGASMSVSIVEAGRLWGLISLHNAEPRRASFSVRNACDFLAQMFAVQIALRERAAEADYRASLARHHALLLARMSEGESLAAGVTKAGDLLLAAVGADGAAFFEGESSTAVGHAPPPEAIARLVAWLQDQHGGDTFMTDRLSEEFPEAAAYADVASGLLAVSISRVNSSYVLWFRREIVETVTWGGEPAKAVSGEPGAQRLHPRKSFETWRETVRHRAPPFQPVEVESALVLRTAIVDVVLRRAEEMAALAQDLQRSNRELESFSYSVSHDLRAPFRHIVGYSELLREREGKKLSEAGLRFIETIIESAYQAGTLVDNLLNFSQMGRTALHRRPIDMNLLVDETRRSVMAAAPNRQVEWLIGRLGVIWADPVLMRAAVENLLSNAVKYTRNREQAVVEIQREDREGEAIFTVRDNGIGFDMAYVGKLFGVFQRLHRMEDFEGTGIGLANVRRIVERHGGRTWAEGRLDEGALFGFSLPRAPADEAAIGFRRDGDAAQQV